MILTDLIKNISPGTYLLVYVPERLLYYGNVEYLTDHHLLLVNVNHIYPTIRMDVPALAICLEESEV